jgi:hypothetical protein
MPVDKRAGQRAKFTKALADYQRTDDDERHHAARLMAEVIMDAPKNGFTEAEVTQGADVPDEVRRLIANPIGAVEKQPDDADVLTKELKQTVDSTDYQELGSGSSVRVRLRPLYTRPDLRLAEPKEMSLTESYVRLTKARQIDRHSR